MDVSTRRGFGLSSFLAHELPLLMRTIDTRSATDGVNGPSHSPCSGVYRMRYGEGVPPVVPHRVVAAQPPSLMTASIDCELPLEIAIART